MDDILFYIDTKHQSKRRAVVPEHIRKRVMEETHGGTLGGHYPGNRLYNTLARHWWWEGMYLDAIRYSKSCPECAIVSGGGKQYRPPLHPIPVERPFQIVGVDIMDLPKTQRGNKLVIVFQDFFSKWPMVYPIPDQKAVRIAQLIAEEVVPFFGVPEALLSDRGTNLLSHLVLDLCKLLGIKKLNTTAYHPQCDGMVERFNRTLKAMVRKQATKFGSQWDQYLSGVLWAYRNTPHEATGEKPSFLLFGMDCRSPTEAALLPPTPIQAVDVSDYREEMILSLSTARDLASKCIQRAQKKYKKHYDQKAAPRPYRVSDWVLVKFPHEETGSLRKLSQPWHGPYRILACKDPDVTVGKVYFPQDGQIQVHQLRVAPCPEEFPAGYYWYGKKKHSPGRPPGWVEQLLSSQPLPGPDQSQEQEPEQQPEEDNRSETDTTEFETEASNDEEFDNKEMTEDEISQKPEARTPITDTHREH